MYYAPISTNHHIYPTISVYSSANEQYPQPNLSSAYLSDELQSVRLHTIFCRLRYYPISGVFLLELDICIALSFLHKKKPYSNNLLHSPTTSSSDIDLPYQGNSMSNNTTQYLTSDQHASFLSI